MGRGCRTAEERLFAEGSNSDAVDAAGGRGVCAVDCMRECGQSASGQRNDAAKGDCNTVISWGFKERDLRAIPYGEFAACFDWRFVGSRSGRSFAALACSFDATGHSSIGSTAQFESADFTVYLCRLHA